jgi:hypothetical protein
MVDKRPKHFGTHWGITRGYTKGKDATLLAILAPEISEGIMSAMKHFWTSMGSFFVVIIMAAQVPHVLATGKSSLQIEMGVVDSAISQLWAADERGRSQGKRALIELGPQTTGPLVELLKDLVRNRHERYMIGREVAGREASERYRALNENATNEDRQEALNQSLKWEITHRLREDVIDLLVIQRAEDAVPVLVELMLQDLAIAGLHREMFLPGARGLIRIGPEAVPKLIAIIENPKIVNTFSEQFVSTLPYEDRRRYEESGNRLVQGLVAEVLVSINHVELSAARRASSPEK